LFAPDEAICAVNGERIVIRVVVPAFTALTPDVWIAVWGEEGFA
jgi:hypothetical protein